MQAGSSAVPPVLDPPTLPALFALLSGLSGAEYKILSVLCQGADNAGRVSTSLSNLVARTGESLSTVQRNLRKLERGPLQRAHGGTSTHAYTISEAVLYGRNDHSTPGQSDHSAHGQGEDSRARVESMVLDTTQVYRSNRSVESIEKPAEKKNQPRSDRAELRAKLNPEDVETLEARLRQDFGQREELLPEVGSGAHPIALLLLNLAKHYGFGYVAVQGVMDEIWRRRYDDEGIPKPGTAKMQHWGYLHDCLRKELLKKIPPQRETQIAGGEVPRTGRGELVTDPLSKQMLDQLMKAGGS
jgi:hypothetical protein